MKEGKETVVGSVVFDCAAAALTKLDLYLPIALMDYTKRYYLYVYVP